MQGGACRELIPHEHGDGLIVRDIATGKTFEAVKFVKRKAKRERWRIPWDDKTSNIREEGYYGREGETK